MNKRQKKKKFKLFRKKQIKVKKSKDGLDVIYCEPLSSYVRYYKKRIYKPNTTMAKVGRDNKIGFEIYAPEKIKGDGTNISRGKNSEDLGE